MEIQDLPAWERILGGQTVLDFVLEVTARCNNDCRHCYINLPANNRAAKANELTLEEIDRLAGEAVESSPTLA